MHLVSMNNGAIALELSVRDPDHGGPEAVDLLLAVELGVKELTGFQHV